MSVQRSPSRLLIDLDRKVSRAMECGRGLTLSPEQLDALASIGLVAKLAEAKATILMEEARCRQTRVTASDEWLVCREVKSFDRDQQIDTIEQVRVASVRSAWDSARDALGIPSGWGPKLIRHSMSTILARRKVDLVELEMLLGHRVLGKTSSRYVIFDPSYLGTIRDGIEDVLGDLARRSGGALHPKLTRAHDNVVPLRA